MASQQRIFHQLAARAGLMTAAPAAVALWAFGPLAAVSAGAAVTGLELWRVRSAVRSGIPEALTFCPSRPADHPWLDADAFHHDLSALETLGFLPVADYTIVYPKAPTGLARVLVHTDHCVYAEVNQVRRKGRTTPVTTTLTSLLDDGWSLQTTTQEPLPVAVAFMQTRRLLWRTLPSATVAELLDDHTELRTRICADLGVGVGGDGTLERYFELQKSSHEARRDALRHTNVVTGIARGIAAERHPRREWFGEYQPAVGGVTPATPPA
jgi:hypothetical protein